MSIREETVAMKVGAQLETTMAKGCIKPSFGRTVDEVAVKMEAFRNETNSIAVSLSFSDA